MKTILLIAITLVIGCKSQPIEHPKPFIETKYSTEWEEQWQQERGFGKANGEVSQPTIHR